MELAENEKREDEVIQEDQEKIEEEIEKIIEEQPEAEPEGAAAGAEGELEELRSKLKDMERQRDEYLDSLRRAQADFINYKRHNERARSDGYEDGSREAIAAVLPAIDSMERAIAAAEDGPLKDGVEKTLKLLFEALAKRGLEEIPALDEPFDPDKHNAVASGESDKEPGTIIEVYQKGYRVREKIIRYAMVKVSAD